ncbi:hypothetical protein quinque_007792 [Culex quinquefasciatus]
MIYSRQQADVEHLGITGNCGQSVCRPAESRTLTCGRRTSPDQPAVEAETETELARAVQRILIPDQFATTFERLENNVALLVLQPIKVKKHPQESFPSSIDEGGSIFKQVFGSRTPGIITKSGLVNVGQHSYPFEETSSLDGSDDDSGQQCRREHRDYLQHQGNLCAGPADKSRTLDVDLSGSPLLCTATSPSSGVTRVELRGILTWSTDINRAPHLFTNITTYRGWIDGRRTSPDQPAVEAETETELARAVQRILIPDQFCNDLRATREQCCSLDGSDDDSGQQCRREHRDYLQHQGNLCAGPADKSRTLDVDLSGSPLLCTATSPSSGVTRVELRGILTWSTDINRAPHLFTNITTYRGWIESELDKLDLQLELTRSVAGAGRRRRRQSGTGS